MAKAKAKAPKAKAAKKCSCEGMPALVVTSKVKEYIKSKKMQSSSDAIAALSCKVYCMLDAAIERTASNRRSTVKPQDL
jgi:hypothetical protein